MDQPDFILFFFEKYSLEAIADWEAIADSGALDDTLVCSLEREG
jgi:hypothetical protein